MVETNKSLSLMDLLETRQEKPGNIAFLSPEDLLGLSPKFNSGAEKIQRYALSVSTNLNVEQTCLKGVRTALEAAGVVDEHFFDGAEHAYQMIDKFQKNPKFVEIDCAVEDLDLLPAGAVVVWNHGNGNDAPSGHISVSNGDGMEMSDHACAQNTTGTRPGRNEQYGQKHVFLLKDGFTYNPWFVEYVSSHIDTTTNSASMAHATLLLGTILQNENVTLRSMELAHAYQVDETGEGGAEIIKAKQKYVYFISRLLKLPGGKQNSDVEVSPRELFTKIVDILNQDNISDEDLAFINQMLSSNDITKLNEIYNSRNPEFGIQALVGTDDQLYIYQVSSDGDVDMCYNSRGNTKIGWLAAIVRLIREIERDSNLPKDKKDKQLGNKIVNVLSGISSFIGHDLLDLYEASLSMDETTPPDVRQRFKEEMQKQIELYQFLQKGYKSVAKVKGKVARILEAIKRLSKRPHHKRGMVNTNANGGRQ